MALEFGAARRAAAARYWKVELGNRPLVRELSPPAGAGKEAVHPKLTLSCKVSQVCFFSLLHIFRLEDNCNYLVDFVVQ